MQLPLPNDAQDIKRIIEEATWVADSGANVWAVYRKPEAASQHVSRSLKVPCLDNIATVYTS